MLCKFFSIFNFLLIKMNKSYDLYAETKRENEINKFKNMNRAEILLLIFIILLFIVLFIVIYFGYQWAMYYINIGEQYVNDFNNQKAKIQQIVKTTTDTNIKLKEIENKITSKT